MNNLTSSIICILYKIIAFCYIFLAMASIKADAILFESFLAFLDIISLSGLSTTETMAYLLLFFSKCPITCEISRLGRSLLEVMKILETCLNKNCQVWTIKENYRLGNDIQSKVLAFAFGLAAEIERNLISQRTKSSLANIKASGKKLGRPFTSESKKLKLSKNAKKFKELFDKGLSKSQLAKTFGVSRNTVRHFIDRMLLSVT